MNTHSSPTSSGLTLQQAPSTPPDLQRASSPDTGLQQPIAIPATSAALGSPFLRAYPIELEAYHLPAPTFLSFIDELNRLMVASPPLRVLGLAGNIVSMVPLATAQIVGGAVNAAATVSQVAMSKSLAAMFIRKANEDTFGPLGLQANIVKLEVVAKAAGIPILDAAGKIKKGTELLAPMENPGQDVSGQHRRLMAIAPYTSPLHVLPDEHKDVPDNLFDKMHTCASERQRSKAEKKVLENREKGHKERNKDTNKAQKDFNKEMSKLEKEEAKVRRKEAKKPEKMESELRKLDKERTQVHREYEKETGKAIKKDKEEAAVRKILWLLIQKKDAVAPQGKDTTEYWNASPQYRDHVERYRAERLTQASPHVQDTLIAQQHAAGEQVSTGPYLGNGQYQGRVQNLGESVCDRPPPYQEGMRY